MDHTYNIFNDIEPNLNGETLTNEDELLAAKLSAIDYLSSGDLENAFEVLTDLIELDNKEKEE